MSKENAIKLRETCLEQLAEMLEVKPGKPPRIKVDERSARFLLDLHAACVQHLASQASFPATTV